MDNQYANEEEYDYLQISNPAHPAFDPHWYEICEIPDDDPWFNIVNDFFDGRVFINAMIKKKLIKNRSVIKTKKYESNEFSDVIDISGNEAAFWISSIEYSISRKEVDAEFLYYWGEFQKFIARAKLAYPTLIKRQRIGKHSQKNNKDPQRQWYVLWLYHDPDKSRPDVNKELTELCSDILKSKIAPPDGWSERKLRNFVAEMAGEGSRFKLSSTFSGKHLYKKADLDRLYRLALANPALPPVGAHKYKKI